MTTLVWFRRDFRLADNPALTAAIKAGAPVLAVYIHAPEEQAPWQPGAASNWWLHHSLAALSKSLAELGSSLLLLRGPSLQALQQLIAQHGVTAVHWNRLYEPACIARDALIKQTLRGQGIAAESHNSALLFEPWQLKTATGTPYRVFSPLWRKAEAELEAQLPTPLPAPARLQGPASRPSGVTLESLNLLPSIAWDAGFSPRWTPGEAGAAQRLQAFAEGPMAHYKEQRDLPAVRATSSLSPHLHFGEVSPRQAFAVARLESAGATPGVQRNANHFVRELAWREFSHHLLFHYPATVDAPMLDKFASFPWRKSTGYLADLKAWQQGRTGVPIVDAGMRELWATGWMHNRVRMIVGSFLTKNLLIPWQEGARWFWDTLVDASLPQNTLGWQWVAGCGADAAPYFRIFNPILQGEKFDADGSYTRHWVPELARLDARFLHRPWEAPGALRRGAGIGLDSPYAKPIVDLAESRQRALAAYAEIKAAE